MQLQNEYLSQNQLQNSICYQKTSKFSLQTSQKILKQLFKILNFSRMRSSKVKQLLDLPSTIERRK